MTVDFVTEIVIDPHNDSNMPSQPNHNPATNNNTQQHDSQYRFEDWESAVPPSLPKEAQQAGEAFQYALPQPVESVPAVAAGNIENRPNQESPIRNRFPPPIPPETDEYPSLKINPHTSIINTVTDAQTRSNHESLSTNHKNQCYATNRSSSSGAGSVNPTQEPALALTIDDYIPIAAAGARRLANSQASRQYFRKEQSSGASSNLSISPIQQTCPDFTDSTNETFLIQWNIRSVWANYNEFRKIVDERLPITICLQEMMTSQTLNLLKNRYHWTICSRPESLGNGIAGLGVRRDVPF